MFTWRAKAEVYSTWRKAHHGLESFLCLWDMAGGGGDYERPRRGNFCTAGDGKINRGIRVKPKTGFRCLEEAAVGEFNPSKEGSKPTPHLISSHSEAFLELRHGVVLGQGHLFQNTRVGQELSFCVGTGEKSLKQARGWKPLFQNTILLLSALRTFPQQRTCSWSHTLLSHLQC